MEEPTDDGALVTLLEFPAEVLWTAGEKTQVDSAAPGLGCSVWLVFVFGDGVGIVSGSGSEIESGLGAAGRVIMGFCGTDPIGPTAGSPGPGFGVVKVGTG